MRIVVSGIVIAAIFITAIGTVFSRHQSRRQFGELQVLQQQRDVMNDEWRQLLVEQATSGEPGTVERKAQDKLGMRVPSSDAVTAVVH